MATVHAIYPPEPNLDIAIDFLKTMNPDGWQCLTSKKAGGDWIDRFFAPGMWDEKRAVMAAWAAEQRNIYFLINEPKAGATSREKTDIAFIRAVCSDTDHHGVQEKALATIVDPTASQSSFVNNSGGGIHTFWILTEKVAVNAVVEAAAETAGRGLREFFAGDAVQNINRIMRVPGTVNWLDEKKIARGRNIALCTILAEGPGRVTLEDVIRDYPAPAGGTSSAVNSEAVKKAMAEIDMRVVGKAGGTYDKLPKGLRDRFEATRAFTKGLWINGNTTGDATGSGNVFKLALILRELGFTGTEFGSIADCWTLVKTENVEHRQLARAWVRASPGAQASRKFPDNPQDAGELPPEPEPAPVKGKLTAVGGLDPTTFPRREWLYGRRLIRKYLSSTVAAGGTGKSSLTMVEAVSMVSGIDLLGVGLDRMPRELLRVLIWNGEDPAEELMRRLMAIQKHYGVTDAQIDGRLFLASGREYRLGLGGENHADDVKWLKETIEENKIDVVMVDPFVSSHRVPENDNMAIDRVAKTWSHLAEVCKCAVDLVHHIRKPMNGGAVDLSVDDARGASALINASRNARVLSPMTNDMATKLQVNRRAYFAIQHDATKANMSPGMTGVDWFHFVSVDLGNGDPFAAPPVEGDSVGVVETWTPTMAVSKDPVKIIAAQGLIAKGNYRKSDQTNDWVGGPIAEALGLDLEKDKRLILLTVKEWLADGWLVEVHIKDSNHTPRPYIIVGAQPDRMGDFGETPTTT